jgi:hypothetical protein
MPLVWRAVVLTSACVLLCTPSLRGQAPPPSTPAPSSQADALAEAARKGDAATVAKLLDAGVDVNTKFRYGATALSYACDHGQLDVVRLLLDRGADVNVKDTFYGATPLTWASSPAMKRKPEHAEIVGLLLKRGATGKGNALLSAVSEGDVAMTKVILESGALPADTMSDALEAATGAKHIDVVAVLTAAGAKPHPEVKLDAAQLARYAGTYRSGAGPDVVVSVTADHLVLRAGQPLTLVARSEEVFAAREAPGLKITFRLENGKAVSFVLNGTTYSRTGGQ